MGFDTARFDGLARIVEAFRAGELSSAQAVDASLRAIAESQPVLNAFRCVREEAARQEAAEADRRLAAGGTAAEGGGRAPLLGVPVAIKDDMDLAGETTAFGCGGTFERKAADAEVARRLKAAGAVIVGKTTTPELGQWPWAESSACGITRNPWNPDHTPGGSSAGSAAAVAAGLVPAAVGSDGAGSIRIPAAWCHLVGIKPQRGRVSTWPYPESFQGLTVYGPLARTVGDAALLLDVLTGNHPGDLHRPPAPTEPFAAAARRAPGRLRIALSLRIPFSGPPARLHPAIESAVRRLGDVLAGLGHDVYEADPDYGPVGAAFVPRSTVGVRELVDRHPDPSVLDSRTRENARMGRLLGGPVLAAARAAEGVFARRIGRIFRRVDVVLAPTTAQPPPRAGASEGLSNWATDKLMVGACPYAWPWNVIGWPAVNVPAGFADGGLPVGAQLMGPANAEPLLISLAAQLEYAERWMDKRPPEIAAAAAA